MSLEMTVTGSGVPTAAEQAAGQGGTDRAQSWLARAAPAASLVCWFYLSIVVCLVVWVIVVRLLVGWTPIVVTTGSMEPSINAGDIVLTSAPEDGGRGLDEGAVITFADPVKPGGRITHRIDRVNEDGTYQTRGDGNTVSDSYQVKPHDVIGVGRLLVPAVGQPRVWLEQGDLPRLSLWVIGSLLALWAAVRPTRRGRHG